jgi:hypothetical protein
MKIVRIMFLLGIILVLGFSCKNIPNVKSRFITKIDSLKSEQEIINFIKEKFPEVESRNFKLNAALPDFAVKSEAPRWSLNDVDGNGYKDLVVNLNLDNTFYTYIIFADSSKFNICSLSSIWEYAGSFSRFLTINNEPAILLSGYAMGNDLKTDTLVYKYESFIEYNSVANNNRINKIEMHLNMSGTESDHFPNINALIDFTTDSSSCHKWFSNPAYKDFIYTMSKADIHKILNILRYADLNKIKRRKYDTGKSDQPSSKIRIFSDKKTLAINDYGLEGSYTLKELYKLVYKY